MLALYRTVLLCYISVRSVIYCATVCSVHGVLLLNGKIIFASYMKEIIVKVISDGSFYILRVF